MKRITSRLSTLAVLTLVSGLLVTGCSIETPVAPTDLTEPGASGLEVGSGADFAKNGGEGTLVVDDNAEDCPNADFDTIQDAVDAADPNTTILVCAGTYNERVVITGAEKEGLRVLAKGAPDTVVLDGDNPSPLLPGNHAFHLLEVSGVLIEGFTVREYFENIKLTNSSGNRIRKNRTTAAGHDGIILDNSADNIIEHNVSFDNLGGNACGINLVLGSTGNLVRHNVLQNNNWGIRIIAGSTDNRVFGNESRDNRSHGIQNANIPPFLPPSSGNGIENNRIENNPIGIEILSSEATVARNRVFNNTVDLVDGGTNNEFVNNHCHTSNPDGLCAHSGGASK